MRGEDIQQSLGIGGSDEPGTEGSVGGEPGECPVGVGDDRRLVREGVEVGRDGRGVTTRDRAGQGGVPVSQDVVEGGTQQRGQQALRLIDTRETQQVDGLGHDRHEVVGAIGQGRVVDHPSRLRHPHRLSAHLDDQGLCDGAYRVCTGHRERTVGETVEVHAGAGERHGRMEGQPEGPDPRSGLEDADAVAAGRMRHELPRVQGTGLDESRDQTGKHVVGNGQQDEVGVSGDLVGGQHRDSGKQCVGTQPREVGDCGHRDDLMPRATQGRTEDGADAPGTDDAHTQAWRLRFTRHPRERRGSPRRGRRESPRFCQDDRMPTEQLFAVGTAALLTRDGVLDVDPRHPAAHPGFQLQVSVADGLVAAADVRIGLMHRSAEKLFESRDLRQAMLLADRHDWLSSFSSEVSVALATESALGILPPERATWTRMALMEVERIGALLPFLAPVSGASRPLVESLRERIVSAMESITGSRMHPAFTRIGGVAAPVTDDDRALVRELLGAVESEFPAVAADVAAQTEGLAGLAVLDTATALGCGLGGPVGRASGVARDLRRDEPYLAYAELDELINVPVHEAGDSRARYAALLDQLPLSVRLARASLERLDSLGDGPIDVPLPKVVRLPEGMTYAAVEGPIGIAGCLLVGAGDKYPWRLKIRSASFATMSAMGTALVGVPVAALADAVMSFPVVMGDADR